MTTYAHKLELFDLDPEVPVYTHSRAEVEMITLDDPAIRVMTDLKRIRAITINPENTIEFAQQLMKHAGVRLLVVIDHTDKLAGLITARDIMSEKPLSIVTREKIRRQDVQVAQIMTPRSELEPFNIRDVEHASVKDVIRKLREFGRQHAIVVEEREGGKAYFVRGIFSITQIGRQLGMEIPSDGHVQSFAEFEQLIA
ncbi:MAG: CBS domain-containing protein [Gammaproteobacteria bacterium]|nr:CBS domain-containing protein [Gammaproteobacteria bacterium]